MKIMFELVTVLFSMNCVYPVLMYYIYDDNPIAGYVSNNEIGSYPLSKLSGHKKYLASSNNQKGMKLVNERAVDSHFKILKASPVSFAAVPIDNQYTPKMRKFTEPPQKNLLNLSRAQQKKVNIQNSGQSKPSVINEVQKHMNEGLFKPNIRNYFENLNVFNDLQIKDLNARKNLMDDKKKMTKTNNRRPYSQQNYFHKSNGPSVKDKVLHKSNINSEQSAQLMTYMLNEIAQKFLDRKYQNPGEYRKRDAIHSDNLHSRAANGNNANHKNKHVSNDIVENNLKNILKQGKVIAPRIGSYDLGVEMNDTPYALFYRMNHENIAQSNFFPPPDERTIDEPANAQNKHRISVAYAQNIVRDNRRPVNIRNKSNNYAVFRDR